LRVLCAPWLILCVRTVPQSDGCVLQEGRGGCGVCALPLRRQPHPSRPDARGREFAPACPLLVVRAHCTLCRCACAQLEMEDQDEIDAMVRELVVQWLFVKGLSLVLFRRSPKRAAADERSWCVSRSGRIKNPSNFNATLPSTKRIDKPAREGASGPIRLFRARAGRRGASGTGTGCEHTRTEAHRAWVRERERSRARRVLT
jgi:hypothetical protein